MKSQNIPLDHFGNPWIFEDGWQQLVCDVLHLAKLESRYDKDARKFIHEAPAFELMCDALDTNPENIRKRISKKNPGGQFKPKQDYSVQRQTIRACEKIRQIEMAFI
jgi:hypothetical protein